MKVITEKLIRSLNISPKLCVEWIRQSFQLKQDAQLPAKISVHPSGFDFFTSMPCLLPPPTDITQAESSQPHSGIRFFGVKVVHRLQNSIPALGSDMLLYDANDGKLLALMECDWITTMRTGAVAAAASQVLRKTDASVYGFIGLGNTARATLLCILESEPEKSFNVRLLRYKDTAELFIQRFKEYTNVTFEIVDDIHSLISGVDVLFSCITSADGLLVPDESSFKPGITIIPVHMRGFQNCDKTFDRVFGDDTDHVRNFEFFDDFHDYNEIGEVLAGRDPGRRNDNERIINYNYGLALHDVFFGSKIYEMVQGTDIPDIYTEKEKSKYWV